MFDIGFWELALIAVVALLVVGPERLPKMAREAGIWVGRVRRYVQHVKDDIESEIRAEGIKEMMQQPASLDDFADLAEETRASLDEARGALESTAADASAASDESASGQVSPASHMFQQAAPVPDPAAGVGEPPAEPPPADAVPAETVNENDDPRT